MVELGATFESVELVSELDHRGPARGGDRLAVEVEVVRQLAMREVGIDRDAAPDQQADDRQPEQTSVHADTMAAIRAAIPVAN